MKVSDFHYQLPEHLIAQFPTEERTASRLLVMQGDGRIEDHAFSDIVDQLNTGDLLVLNNTKVIPARLYGRKESGGKIELLLERIHSENHFTAQIKASRAPKPGQKLFIDADQQAELEVSGRNGTFFELQAKLEGDIFDWFERVGHMPLPPYIQRSDNDDDESRYQTVFAEEMGAVAAPTAGLHYDEALLEKIKNKGVEITHVTLHVGAGTYQPVRVEDLNDHQMHSEYIDVRSDTCERINACKQRGGRVVAVGTTVMRSLETAAQHSQGKVIEPFQGDTDIFIYPGFDFKVVDCLQTNFHLPESTLMMLVSAFSGYDNIMRAYKHAIDKEYRFFSYGDAMFLHRSQ